MSFQVTVRTENFREVDKLLEELPYTLRKETESDLDRIVRRVRDMAKQYCPVDTGSLKASIRVYKYNAPAGVWHILSVSAGGYVTNPKTGRKVDYAYYVEWGTSKMQAQPFMRPAWQANRAELRRVMREAAKQAVRLP